MKNTHLVINNIKPLLHSQVKLADRQGLSEIRISTARAKELLHLCIAADKEIEDSYPLPEHFHRLDQIFGEALERIS
jgi:hypothetical protein